MAFDSEKFDWLINESNLTFNIGADVLMHYYNPVAIENKQDPAWRNQGIYFWYDSENFDKKSLPDDFEQMQKKLFTIDHIPQGVMIQSALAIPWFGKPGGGTKLFFSYLDDALTLSEAHKLGALTYVEKVELTIENLSILQDRDNYMFLTSKEVSFANSLPIFKGQKTSLSDLYHSGEISILKVL